MSFSARLWLSAISALAALAVLVGAELVLTAMLDRASTGEQHNRVLIRATNQVLDDLQDAETAQRGYLLVGNPAYLAPYENARSVVRGDLAKLERAAQDAPEVGPPVASLERIAIEKFDELAETVRLERAGRHAAALAIVQSGRGANAMTTARATIATITAIETHLRDDRESQVGALRIAVVWVLALGAPLLTALLVGLTWRSVTDWRASFAWLHRRIAAIREHRMMDEAIGSGNEELLGVAREFDALGAALDAERERRTRTEDELRSSNRELERQRTVLERRAELSELRRRMANRLSGCVSVGECLAVIRQLLPSAVSDVPGAFYLYDNSRRFLSSVLRWNDPPTQTEEFSPDDCWAVRRGQPHRVVNPSRDIVCAHVGTVAGRPVSPYTCTPIAAQGETIGLLYLQLGIDDENLPEDELHLLAEMLAISLANVRLRESLRTASLRDPLTGLFNRRYLQEAWELESARALRAGRTLALLMLDVDHFKTFNDRFGHDAGDRILKSVAETLRTGTRTGDVVCRFGGEEFIIVLVDADDESALVRAEALRRAVKGLSFDYGAERTATITVSIGIATFPLVGRTFEDVQQAADAALYRAKASGRDRVEIAQLTPPA